MSRLVASEPLAEEQRNGRDGSRCGRTRRTEPMTWWTMLAGAGGLVVGMFLALALTATRS